jgi:hypothetical protein
MNEPLTLEDRLQALGSALQARSRVSDRAMEEIRKLQGERPSRKMSQPMPLNAVHQKRRLLAAMIGLTATTCAAVFVAVTLFRSPSVGWAEVTKALESQNWIRGTISAPNGQRTMWLSPRRQVWAFSGSYFKQFCDGPSHTKYERHGSRQPILKLPLGDIDAEKILPLAALSQDQDTISPWVFGMDKVIAQSRSEVTEDGKTWIDFHLVLWRLDNNEGTLRVDPKTKLPVELRFNSDKDPTKSYKWTFDYPAEGPGDIYALGVPHDVKIEDRMPSADAQKVLDAMAASRARIGDFRMVMSDEAHEDAIVWRKGNRWREDLCFPLEDVGVKVSPADAQASKTWFETQLNQTLWIPRFICDGQRVWANDRCRPGSTPHWTMPRIGPQDLMSGDRNANLGSRARIAAQLYPDLTPRAGDTFEFDPQPADAPGCEMIEQSAPDTGGQVSHARYYVDPTKGYAVVRIEVYRLPENAANNPQSSKEHETVRLEDFQHPTPNFWYPAIVHDETIDVDPNGKEVRDSTTARYHIDFDIEMPDSLFKLDEDRVKN